MSQDEELFKIRADSSEMYSFIVILPFIKMFHGILLFILKFREAEDAARAITASLAEMQRTSHVNVVDQALLRPALSTEQKKEEKYEETSKDFPTLDGKVIDEDRTSDEDVALGKDPGKTARKDTMAKKVARANMFSVAEGDLNTEDFPSLGGGSSGNRPAVAAAKVPSVVAKVPAAATKKPARNTNVQHWQAPASVTDDDFPSLGGRPVKQPVMPVQEKIPEKSVRNVAPKQRQAPVAEEDFPVLGGSSKPRLGFPLKQNTWVSSSSTGAFTKIAAPKPVQNKPQQKPPQSKPQSQPKSTSYQDYPTLGSIGGSLTKTLNKKGTSEELLAAAPVPSSQTMTSNVQVIKAASESYTSLSNVASIINKPPSVTEGDFPSLGKGKKPGQSSLHWGPKPKDPEPEEKQTKSDKQESQFMVAKLKNKNKKENKKENLEDFENGSPLGSDSETTLRTKSLKGKIKVDSDFDYEIKSEIQEPMANESERTTSVKSKKKKANEAKENKACAVPSSSDPKKLNLKTGAKFSDTKVPSSRSADLPSTDDFSTLTALKDQSNLPSKMAEFKLDDFPVLSGSAGTTPIVTPPPPGLTKPRPPGFSFSPVSSSTTVTKPTPPPGFSSLGGLVTQMKVEPELTSELVLPAQDAEGSGEPEYEYTPPPEFMTRNQRLIAAIQRYVKNDESRFKEFKSCSGQFRTDKMGPYDYYDRCSNIIGKDNFRIIFPELLVLLPDISKQQELLMAHNAAIRLSQGKKSQGKGKKTAMWSSVEQSQFASCSVCSQVVLQKDLSTHQKEHNIEADFPSLGSTTTSGSSYGMSAWVKAK